ncbi:MAG: hypothetical protein IT364_14525 [Candidatus Hydrogenedentes bacterium]|nr:hypothetical protein [Candidatus Hydrogenedentota bacterium]
MEELDPREAGITPELYLQWRSPRRGRHNPDQMNNPVWEWLVRSRLSAYAAGQMLQGPSSCEAGPGWCCDRFGQSSTRLPDERVILIAGEHEDFYDPDFYIYNDVIVVHPNGAIDIYGYPTEDFPPTDFHSATLVDNQIVLIGNLGYSEQRVHGMTQVLLLDTHSFRITAICPVGSPPGWIHSHLAILSMDRQSITIEKGKLDRGTGESLSENIDEWVLHLADWRWERITRRQWPRWEVVRRDRQPIHLFQMQQALWFREASVKRAMMVELDFLGEFGRMPALHLVSELHRPALPHEVLPQVEGEFRAFRILLDGVVVRYVEDIFSVQVTVEGELPPHTLEALQADLVQKMSMLENTSCELLPI